MHTRVFISERSTLSSMSRGARDVRVSLMPYLARFFYPWADGIIAVSKGVADDLAHTIGIPENLIRVIYNPVITPELKRKVLEPISHPWFMPGQPPVILAVGRLSKAKDYPTLLKAFKKIRQSVNARLLILGEGEERPALNLLIQQLGIEEDVSLPGFVPNPYPFMAHAALFVLSSVREGLPGSLIEALFCGVPVVSTDCKSGPAEILDHGRYGKLVPVGDVDALAQEIMITLEQKTRHVPEEAIQPYEFEYAVNLYINALMGN